MTAYPRITPPSRAPSPAEIERQRLDRAQRRVQKFCEDLDRLVGRGEEADELSDRIYQAALDKQVELEHLDGWLLRCARVLERMRSDLKSAAAARVESRSDPDAAWALEHAARYFGHISVPRSMHRDLAACLLDYGFASPPPLADVVPAPSRSLARADPQADRSGSELAIRESRSLLHMAKSLRWGGAVVLGCLYLATGKAVFLPLLAVLFLMTWMLVDRKAILREDAVPALPELLERDLTEPSPAKALGVSVQEASRNLKILAQAMRGHDRKERRSAAKRRCFCCRTEWGIAGVLRAGPVCAACLDALEERRCPLCGVPLKEEVRGPCPPCVEDQARLS